jgi:predicted GIY-YIG superfamily endonuclease
MFYLYILFNSANKLHSIGVTNNMQRRLKVLSLNNNEHLKVVYYETFEDSHTAIQREDDLNNMPKEVILELVKNNNPLLMDLTNL